MNRLFQKAYDSTARGLRFQFVTTPSANVSPLDARQILDRVVDSTELKIKAVA